MPTNAITTPYKKTAMLVTMRYIGAGGTVWHRYAAWDQTISKDIGDGNGIQSFSPVPTLGVAIPKQVSGLEPPEPLRLDFPRDTFIDRISDGMPHAPIYVRVAELLTNDTTPGQDVVLTHYTGRVATTTRNEAGKQDRVGIEVTNFKHRLKFAMGLPANHTCAWTFADDSGLTGVAGANCTIDASALTQTGTMTVISGKRVTITGLTTPGGAANVNYWRRGWVAQGHLLIQIRDFNVASPTIFDLVKQPPAEFTTGTVVVCPGCEKTKSVCLDRWNNIPNFMGFGDAIPSRNPTQELP